MINRRPLNIPPSKKNTVCTTITAHYRKDGWQNVLQGTTSLVKAPAILVKYE